MNKHVIFGISIIGITVYHAVIKAIPNYSLLFNHHAMLLVFGGTLGVSLFTLRTDQILSFIKLFFSGFLFKRKLDAHAVTKELIFACHAYKTQGSSAIAQLVTHHQLIKEGYTLITDGVLSTEEIYSVLNKRKHFFRKNYYEDAKVLSSLAKYPPAFGLLGATSGMIAMMGNLGSGDKSQIGLGMATALVATLWGIGLSNFIILPFADYTDRLSFEDSKMRDLIVEGLYLIACKEDVTAMSEKLNSYIYMNERAKYTLKKQNTQLKDAA